MLALLLFLEPPLLLRPAVALLRLLLLDVTCLLLLLLLDAARLLLVRLLHLLLLRRQLRRPHPAAAQGCEGPCRHSGSILTHMGAVACWLRYCWLVHPAAITAALPPSLNPAVPNHVCPACTAHLSFMYRSSICSHRSLPSSLRPALYCSSGAG